jgi:DNA-binding MarR family transcriptional regulator
MVRALKPLNLTLVQFVLLAGVAWLERGSELVTQARLARHAKTDIMMTSQVLRKLEKRRLIIRAQSQSDPRANALKLTEQGREVASKALRIVQDVESSFFGLLAERYGEFLGILEKLVKESEYKEVN